MEFLKEILGEELYKQFEEKVNAYNGNEANKDKQIKLANLSSLNDRAEMVHRSTEFGIEE